MHHSPKQGYFHGVVTEKIKSWYFEQYGGLAKRYAMWYIGAMYTHNMLHDQLVGWMHRICTRIHAYRMMTSYIKGSGVQVNGLPALQ